MQNDFIMEFFGFTKDYIRDTPDLFRRWCGIALVAAALERRVWAPIGGYVVFPNLYIFLIGPSGTGKGIIEDARRLIEGIRDPATKGPMFFTNPDNTTNASMLDELGKARIVRLPPEGKGGPICYHAMSVWIEDINGWMPKYDPVIFGSLIALWNNRDDYKETRRSSNVRALTIEKPTLNLMIGIQPEIMGAIFPEEAWHGGLTRRTIMIYSYEMQARRRLDEFIPASIERKADLQAELVKFGQLHGPCEWTPEAYEKMVEWDFTGGPPRPAHSRLIAYNRNRSVFAQKLAIVSTVSRTGGLVIEETDVSRAIEWLTDAERTMPDIFRAMTGRSDGAVLEELWRWMGTSFKGRPEGVPRAKVLQWLSVKVPTDKLERIFAIAEAADFIRKKSSLGEEYIPGPKGPGDF